MFLLQMVLDRNSVDIHSSADFENSSDNKSICIEILDILKTCFFQKAEIKQTLYRGLIRVASHNYSLSVCINSLVLDHMSSWCTRGLSDNKKSLKFENSVVKSKSNDFIVHVSFFLKISFIVVLIFYNLYIGTIRRTYFTSSAHINYKYRIRKL